MRRTGQYWGRRALRRGALLVAVIFAVALLPAGQAAAVHDTGVFELDGNVVHDGTATYDWADLFSATGSSLVSPNGVLLSSTFLKDTALPDPSYFSSNGGGVKDINPTANWGCTTQNNPLAKDNLLNAYAAFVQVPATAPDNAGHLVLYLGSERESNNGTSFAGFWLFMNPVSCNPATGAFTGVHTNGDLLIVSDYTNGGSSQDVSLFKWTGGANGTLAAVANGGVCGSSAMDSMCAIANSKTISTPWSPGSTAGLGTNTFVETGIDLTTALGGTVPCFTFFQAETRSSNQLSATLKDFAAGTFSNCAPPALNTQLKNAADNSNTSSVVVGSSVYDTATLTGAFGAPKGTVTYSLFTNSACTTASTNPTFSGGSNSATVSLTGTGAIPNSPALTFTQSGAPPPTYYWQAHYSGDVPLGGRNLPADSTCASEPLTVTKAPASVVTTPSNMNLVVGTGGFSDTAIVSGGYFPAAGTSPDGTVTFKLYGPFGSASAIGATSCVDSGAGANLAATSANVAAAASPAPTQTSASYQSPPYTPTQSGVYQWVAAYNGNANSQTATSPCGTGGEQVTIAPATPAIATVPSTQSIVVGAGTFSDTANVTMGYFPAAGISPDGTVTFRLYGPFPSAAAITTSSCVDSGAGANRELGPTTVSATTAGATSASYPSPSFAPTQTGVYQWVARYNGNANNVAVASACGDASEEVTVAPASPSITTTPPNTTVVIGNGAAIADTASVTGGYFPAAGISPDGTVTFKLYGPFGAGAITASSCVDTGAGANLLTTFTATALASPAPAQTSASYASGQYVPTVAGAYQWVATYNGNANNNTAATGCGDTTEQVTVQPATPGIASTILLSDSVRVSPVAGAGTPTGSVTFALFGPFASPGSLSCAGSAIPGSTQTIDPLPASGLATTPTPVAVAAPGLYAWQVTYTSTSGNYTNATTSCTAELATIAYQAPSPIS